MGALVCLLLGAGHAAAWKGPPRAYLHVNEERAQIHPWTYEWNRAEGANSCSSLIADGFPGYEPDPSVDSFHVRPRVFFMRDQKPRVTSFRAYSSLGEHGYPTGPSEAVNSSVHRVKDNGEVVAWKVRFATTVADKRYFDLDVAFERAGRCGNNGSASYSFGLERG